jgi:hypothetical protein
VPRTIACPGNYRIEFYSLLLYSSKLYTNCTFDSNSESSEILSNDLQIKLFDDLSFKCNNQSCIINKEIIENSLPNKLECSKLDLEWKCYTKTGFFLYPLFFKSLFFNKIFNSTFEDGQGFTSTPSTAYSFTYFFYIVTLILSTSCIFVGLLFILRRFEPFFFCCLFNLILF